MNRKISSNTYRISGFILIRSTGSFAADILTVCEYLFRYVPVVMGLVYSEVSWILVFVTKRHRSVYFSSFFQKGPKISSVQVTRRTHISLLCSSDSPVGEEYDMTCSSLEQLSTPVQCYCTIINKIWRLLKEYCYKAPVIYMPVRSGTFNLLSIPRLNCWDTTFNKEIFSCRGPILPLVFGLDQEFERVTGISWIISVLFTSGIYRGEGRRGLGHLSFSSIIS